MAQCTTCFDGSEPTNLEGESLAGNIACSFLHTMASQTMEGSPGCLTTQIRAYQGCGCTTFDEARYCTMCENGFYNITFRPKTVPLFPSNPDCSDLLFTERDDGERSCEDVRRAAYHCGCPGAPEPICSFCSEDNQVPANGDALLPPFYNQTCQDLHEVAPFYITSESCTALTDDLPIHAEYYCGCMDIDPTFVGAQCNLCGGDDATAIPYSDWNVVVGAGEEMTCAQVGRMATLATSADFCASLVEDFYSTCCLGIRPTAEPTSSPMERGQTISPDVGTPSPASSGRRLHGTQPMAWALFALCSLWICRRQ